MKFLARISIILFYTQVSTALAQNFHSEYNGESTARITDSSDAYPGQFPYQAAIVWGVPPLIKYRPICGGSIINKSWILTSAQCAQSYSKLGKVKVQAGKYFTNDDGEYVQTRDIAVRLLHSDYDSASNENDIALLKLQNPLYFNERIQPIQLPTVNHKSENNVSIVTGWGSISKQLWLISPKVLRKAKVLIIENSICNDALATFTAEFQVQDSQLCTGPLTETISTCIGDVGGPLVQIEEKKQPIQIGIASWNTYPCGKTGVPSIYTRVSSYLEWIIARIDEV